MSFDLNMPPDERTEDGSNVAGPSSSLGPVTTKKLKRFEIKKWSAVVFWAWDIVVDTCAVCRNHIMDLCIECQANQAVPQVRSAQLPGVSVIMPSTFTASADG